MSEVRFTIPGRLSSMNEVIRNAAWNRYKGGSKRKAEKDHCYWAIRNRAINPEFAKFKSPVVLSIAWIEPNKKRDIDNICGGGQKVLIDSLVMAGVIPNDTREWVKGISHSFPPPDKANPRVVVTVTPCVMGGAPCE